METQTPGTEKTNGNTAASVSPASTAEVSSPRALTAPKATSLAFVPANMDDAWRFATLFAAADIIPDDLKGKPNNLLLVLLAGQELGLTPMQSIRQIYVVKGKVYVSAQLKLALVQRSDECEYFECLHTDSTKATFKTKRKGGKEQTLTFTIEEARAAKLVVSGGNWEKWPQNMCRWRAVSALCDFVYPDIVGGIGTEDELAEIRSQERNAPYLERVAGETPTAPLIPPQPAKVSAPPQHAAETETPKSEVSRSDAVKTAGGITSSEMDKVPPPPVDDAEAKLTELFASATTAKALLPAAKLIMALPSEEHRAHWRAKYSAKVSALSTKGGA